MDYLGLKDSSRDFLDNCAISFFRLRLVLHTCVQTFDVMGEGKIFWELNQPFSCLRTDR
jgi:hypothetical protein